MHDGQARRRLQARGAGRDFLCALFLVGFAGIVLGVLALFGVYAPGPDRGVPVTS